MSELVVHREDKAEEVQHREYTTEEAEPAVQKSHEELLQEIKGKGTELDSSALSELGKLAYRQARDSERQSNPVSPASAVEAVKKNYDESFTILEHIGTGGFGDVYKAQLSDGSVVAVKYCEGGIDREVVAAGLKHPNITPLIEKGKDDKGEYIVREYVEGKNLAELLKTKKLTEQEICLVAKQMYDGVSYLHRKGIVHGDLKPKNILVPDDLKQGDVKITDFGLALKTREEYLEQSLTSSVAKGTLAYLAPEQKYGEVTEKSDVYSLAKVMIEMITGVMPRWAQDQRVPKGEISIQQLEKCLEENPEYRAEMQEISVFVSELEKKIAPAPKQINVQQRVQKTRVYKLKERISNFVSNFFSTQDSSDAETYKSLVKATGKSALDVLKSPVCAAVAKVLVPFAAEYYGMKAAKQLQKQGKENEAVPYFVGSLFISGCEIAYLGIPFISNISVPLPIPMDVIFSVCLVSSAWGKILLSEATTKNL
ncbi:MAG: serine/threonine protein kinase [Candidatus Aenigmarchaeota archaeon]|nr:serine/threonine protein kinase [Candidatus Aenigmarchaeota archaeon]